VFIQYFIATLIVTRKLAHRAASMSQQSADASRDLLARYVNADDSMAPSQLSRGRNSVPAPDIEDARVRGQTGHKRPHAF
jgi:hypothetical protein